LSLTPVGHIAFGFVSRLDEDSVSLGVPFSSSRFISTGSIGDPLDDDGVERMFVETLSERRVVLSLHGDHHELIGVRECRYHC
jgi:hypothetical protein